MASIAGRVIQTVRKHVPSIKFPKRIRQSENRLPGDPPHRPPVISSTLDAISRKTPTMSSFRPTTANSRKVSNLDDLQTYQKLPARYRRRPITQEEMDYIQRGGPD